MQRFLASFERARTGFAAEPPGHRPRYRVAIAGTMAAGCGGSLMLECFPASG